MSAMFVFFLSFVSLRYLILHGSPLCAHPHSLHGSSPEGGSTMTLQPGANSAIQHKWPLRPGVQVHVNGPNSLSLAASGSVLLSPTDQSSNSSGSRPSSAGSEAITQTNSGQRNGSSDKQRSAAEAVAAAGNHPYYETLREKKKRSGGGSSGNATTDSGSESTRSVIRVQGPNRTAKSTAHSAPPPPPSLHQHPTSHQRMSSGTNKKLVRLSNKVPN